MYRIHLSDAKVGERICIKLRFPFMNTRMLNCIILSKTTTSANLDNDLKLIFNPGLNKYMLMSDNDRMITNKIVLAFYRYSKEERAKWNIQ